MGRSLLYKTFMKKASAQSAGKETKFGIIYFVSNEIKTDNETKRERYRKCLIWKSLKSHFYNWWLIFARSSQGSVAFDRLPFGWPTFGRLTIGRLAFGQPAFWTTGIWPTSICLTYNWPIFLTNWHLANLHLVDQHLADWHLVKWHLANQHLVEWHWLTKCSLFIGKKVFHRQV